MSRVLFILTVLTALLWGSAQASTTTTDNYTSDQLAQLVGTIALYPDPLLSNILAASTSPTELQAALALAQSGGKSSSAPGEWPPAVKALTDYPDVLKTMVGNSEWTSALGFAVTNQQADVMKAIQQFRTQAQLAGNLKSGPQITVKQDNDMVVIVPTNPQIIYVPTYNPTVVIQPQQPDAGSVIAAGLVGFGVGIAINNSMWYNHCNWWGYGISAGYWHGGPYWHPGCGPYYPYHPYHPVYNRPVAGNWNHSNWNNYHNTNINYHNTHINNINYHPTNININNHPGGRPNLPNTMPTFNRSYQSSNFQSGAFRMQSGSTERAAFSRGNQSFNRSSTFNRPGGGFEGGYRGGYEGRSLSGYNRSSSGTRSYSSGSRSSSGGGRSFSGGGRGRR